MENHEISTVGDLIEQKRRVKRISQDEMAFKCNITRKAMSNIETNKNLPSLTLFVSIAHALDMDAYELLKEIEERGLLDNYLRKVENKEDKNSK